MSNPARSGSGGEGAPLHVRLVSHTHWDREWYASFQRFRARLVDCIDRVLALVERDPGFCFLLDGQTIVLEDYLEIRPTRRKDLEDAIRAGRIAIGPWYVQPDSLLPSGESHVRNLLEGRRVGEQFGPVSQVAYTPDSFGHPAQFPQLFAGFGLGPFVYWRGNGNEIDALPLEYRWRAPDGSAVVALHLARGYFGAAMLPTDPDAALARLRKLGEALSERTHQGRVLLMNGIDHAQPDPNTGVACEALARATGWRVERGLLDGFADDLREPLPEHRGELVGGRVANLLPGVWSTRTWIKLRNRACERELEAWAEPWAALASVFGLPDERPALRLAWRALLANQAHDSIGGCSDDLVHEQMVARYDESEGLAQQTVRRTLERLAGLGHDRRIPVSEPLEIAVFNPSPRTRSDVVRFAFDPFPAFAAGPQHPALHGLLAVDPAQVGFAVDGEPARLVAGVAEGRYLPGPEQRPLDLEFVARDVPPFGWRRVRLTRGAANADRVDDGREIESGQTRVALSDDGTLQLRLGGREWSGLAALEDIGDRGDSYDFDPVGEALVRSETIGVERRMHPSGLVALRVDRRLRVPRALAPTRDARSEQTVDLVVSLEARLVPGVERVDLQLAIDNTAHDHRLRLLFPTGAATLAFAAATSFDVAQRAPGRADDSGWIHPAPDTFPQQGFVCANGLSVVAPGLNEAAVTPEGCIAITLLRSVGWLSRHDLRTRPGPAGPALATPGAQCPGRLEARLSLLPGLDPAEAREAEVGLRAVAGAADAPLAAGHSLVALEPDDLLLGALKPAQHEDALVLRVLNPGDSARQARITLGFDVAHARSVRLDESPDERALRHDGRQLELEVGAHALRTLLLRAR